MEIELEYLASLCKVVLALIERSKGAQAYICREDEENVHQIIYDVEIEKDKQQ